MSVWDKFKGKKEHKESEEDLTCEVLANRLKAGKDLSDVGAERCFSSRALYLALEDVTGRRIPQGQTWIQV